MSLAALIAVKPGCRPRLVYRVRHGRRSRDDRRKGFTEADYARLLDDAHQQLGGPLVVVWDGPNTHVSGVMADLVAARDWLTVFRLPPYAPELNPVASGVVSLPITRRDKPYGAEYLPPYVSSDFLRRIRGCRPILRVCRHSTGDVFSSCTSGTPRGGMATIDKVVVEACQRDG